MEIETPPSSQYVDVLKEAYAALNRNDIPAFVKILDPQIIRTEPGETSGGSVYRGIEEVTGHFLKARGNWAEGSCETERFTLVGSAVVVSVYVHVRLQNETEWREGRVTDVYLFKNDKAIQFRTFLDEHQAIEWAKADPSA